MTIRAIRTAFCLAAALVSLPTLAQSPMELAHAADAAAPQPDARIRYGDGPQHTAELRLPPGEGPHPVAIVVHGGCWVAEMGGTGMQGFAEMLRKRGIATYDIDYRRVGHEGGGWPGTFEDVRAGVDHLPEIAAQHRLDLSRVTVVGHSAGAHLALWTAARAKLADPWQAKPGAMTIHSAVAIDGPGTLAPMIGIDQMVCGKPVIVPLMGGTPGEQPDRYRIATPADHLPLGVRQLQVKGELGQFMDGYVAAAKAAGDEVLVLAPPKANHFDIVTAGQPNGEAVADWIAANAFRPKG